MPCNCVPFGRFADAGRRRRNRLREVFQPFTQCGDLPLR